MSQVYKLRSEGVESGAFPAPSHRQAFSILEVMVTVSLLAIAVTTTIGVLGQVNQLQQSTVASEAVTITTANITSLYAGASMPEIVAWTDTPNRRLASTDDPEKTTVNELVNRGLLSPEVGQFQGVDATFLQSLRFTAGFFRTIDNSDESGNLDPTKPGLWRAQTIDTLHSGTEQLDTPEHRQQYRIADLDSGAELTQGNPVTLLVQATEEIPGQPVRVLNQYVSTLATERP